MHCENHSEDTDGRRRGGGPAPNAYRLRPTVGMPGVTDPALWQSVAYSLRPLFDVPGAVAEGPGPVYNVTGITRHGRDGARITFGRLTHTNVPVRSPGPAAYLPRFRHMANASGPRYLFPLETRRRCRPSDGSVVPPSGDRAASPEHVRRVPPSRQKGFTVKRRPVYDDARTTGPGPAGYGPAALDAYRRRGPAATFGARLPGRETSTAVGPAAYHPRYGYGAGCRAKFTFGARHSPGSMPYAVPADNAPPPAGHSPQV